jgi:hypothetical protein
MGFRFAEWCGARAQPAKAAHGTTFDDRIKLEFLFG